VSTDAEHAARRELVGHRLRRGAVARPDGIAGAPFMIYHGEVSGYSDGPVEWCRPTRPTS
jgi:hypothetical protein